MMAKMKVPLFWPVVMGKKIRCLLRDDYNDTRAAGAVNATLATPGGSGGSTLNTRTVVDTGSRLNLDAGAANIAAGGAVPGDPGLWYGSLVRTAGRIIMFDVRTLALHINVGIDAGQTGSLSSRVRLSGTDLYYQNGVYGVAVATVAAGTQKIAFVHRTTGEFVFLCSSGIWKLVWLDQSETTNPFYPGFGFFTAGYGAGLLNSICIPELTWLPRYLVYDTFTRADAALGTSETTTWDGLVAPAQAAPVRTWVDSVGTWGVVTNKAMCSALVGGIGIATVDIGLRNVLVRGAPTTIAGGVAGIVASYVDTDNYLLAYHNGTNATLIKRVAGVETTLINAAAVYSLVNFITLMIDGSLVTLYYGTAKIGATQTVSDAEIATGTRVGIYTTDIGNKLDGLAAMPIGTEGQHSALNPFLA